MSLLNSIRLELQHVIEAMHSVTDVDITIVDHDLKRVVGTGFHSEAIGRMAPKNSAFHKCLETGEQYFIKNPRAEAICLGCENHENCNELVEVCLPINYNNEIIGVLGLCAFNEKAKSNLLLNIDAYKKFEDQLTGIIGTMLKEKDYGQKLEYMSNEMSTLINSINEGILIINTDYRIVSKNLFLKENLGIENELFLNEIVTDNIFNQLLEMGFNGEVGPINFSNGNYIIQSNPIFVHNLKQGYILIFSDFNKMKQSVLRSHKNRDIVTFDDIIGESEAIKAVRRQAIQVAKSDASVLVLGETGTGKEVFSRAIHFYSNRSDGVFMALNCGAIPQNLIESELFGYEKGSFTGANQSGKKGYFEVADEGTLFLDEIGELPYNMQVKLLRALEEKEITRVGGHKTIKANPRIISASHRDIAKMTREGKFREDLFYRLNIVPLYIPPLRERGYDVLILAKFFLEKFSKVYNKNINGFSLEAEKLLLSYDFPGNIRELKNLVEYGVIFAEEEIVSKRDIESKMSINVPQEIRPLNILTREFEREIIISKLNLLGEDLNAKKNLAKKLGISLATLYRKLE
ncbi:MAG: sigma 54-interacting transcriptional regulator [Gudongella sp.]|nr:sigma 54-interacting transcriptional regulator [Gudongella sp.]